ncbi:hypothetical protein Syun_027356 [Stephania yunnanensis]|uniref:Uncharacterized protein n=1 Tax=Stephania yunnanensis TaxID=152371 RepID=A0AAP0HR74_9MAGN
MSSVGCERASNQQLRPWPNQSCASSSGSLVRFGLPCDDDDSGGGSFSSFSEEYSVVSHIVYVMYLVLRVRAFNVTCY